MIYILFILFRVPNMTYKRIYYIYDHVVHVCYFNLINPLVFTHFLMKTFLFCF